MVPAPEQVDAMTGTTPVPTLAPRLDWTNLGRMPSPPPPPYSSYVVGVGGAIAAGASSLYEYVPSLRRPVSERTPPPPANPLPPPPVEEVVEEVEEIVEMRHQTFLETLAARFSSVPPEISERRPGFAATVATVVTNRVMGSTAGQTVGNWAANGVSAVNRFLDANGDGTIGREDAVLHLGENAVATFEQRTNYELPRVPLPTMQDVSPTMKTVTGSGLGALTGLAGARVGVAGLVQGTPIAFLAGPQSAMALAAVGGAIGGVVAYLIPSEAKFNTFNYYTDNADETSTLTKYLTHVVIRNDVPHKTKEIDKDGYLYYYFGEYWYNPMNMMYWGSSTTGTPYTKLVWPKPTYQEQFLALQDQAVQKVNERINQFAGDVKERVIGADTAAASATDAAIGLLQDVRTAVQQGMAAVPTIEEGTRRVAESVPGLPEALAAPQRVAEGITNVADTVATAIGGGTSAAGGAAGSVSAAASSIANDVSTATRVVIIIAGVYIVYRVVR